MTEQVLTHKEFSRKGGKSKLDKYGKEVFSQMGKKGGRNLKKKMGNNYYKKIGLLGVEARRRKKELSQTTPLTDNR